MRTTLLIVLLSQAGATPVPGVQVQNGGTPVGQATTLNCTGAGVTCTKSGSTATITVPGGGSGAVPGLPVGSVQYNGDAGGFGGMTHFATNGADPVVTPETSLPSLSGVHVDYQDGFPSVPYYVEQNIGMPLPIGFFNNPGFIPQNSTGGWSTACHSPDNFGAATDTVLFGSATPVTAVGSSAGFAWDAGSLLGRLRWSEHRPGASFTWAGETWSIKRISQVEGFIAWNRFALTGWNGLGNVRVFVGFAVGAISGNDDPSHFGNTMYLGCDALDSNALRVCANSSNDAGSSVCSSLDAGFPCRSTTGAIYDSWFWASPGGAVNYYVERVDTGATATGIVGGLPNPTTQFFDNVQINSADGGAVDAVLLLGGHCEWPHY